MLSLFLFIVAILGLVTYLFAYLIIAKAGFRHHSVTGLISLIPGVNLIVLPTLWNKISKAFVIGTVGLGIAIASWFLGGSQYLANQAQSEPLSSTVKSAQHISNTDVVHKIIELPLPPKPLYYITYQRVKLSQLNTLTAEHIKVELFDERILEGKNIETSATVLLLETVNNGKKKIEKIQLPDIKTLAKLIEKKG